MSVALPSRFRLSPSGAIAIVFLAVSAWFPSLAWAANTDLSLDDAIRLAVVRAPALAARQLQTQAKREDGLRAAALPDPKLTVAVDNLTATGADAFDLTADDMTMKRVGLMQEFPARAKRQARQVLADRSTEEAQALAAATELSVRRSAAEAWIAVWAAHRELAALQALREQATLAVGISKARMGNGIGSVTDTMAIQATVLALDNRIDAARASLDAARGTLARWLDAEPIALATVGAAPDFNVLPVGEAALLASVDRQGALLPWQSREDVAEAQVDLAIAEKHPDWSIGASYGQRAGNRSDMLTLEFSIALPLLMRNRQDRDVAARRAELGAVAASRDDARRAQVEAVRRSFAVWTGLKRQVARRGNEMLPLARDRVETALASYSGGGDLQPWLDARRDEIELDVEHARDLGELGRAWAELAYLLPDEGVQR